jgi:hypothetical protein
VCSPYTFSWTSKGKNSGISTSVWWLDYNRRHQSLLTLRWLGSMDFFLVCFWEGADEFCIGWSWTVGFAHEWVAQNSTSVWGGAWYFLGLRKAWSKPLYGKITCVVWFIPRIWMSSQIRSCGLFINFKTAFWWQFSWHIGTVQEMIKFLCEVKENSNHDT